MVTGPPEKYRKGPSRGRGIFFRRGQPGWGPDVESGGRVETYGFDVA